MADRIVYGLGKTVIDEDLEIVDEGDSTKKLQWEVSGIATGTTVTMTAPMSDVDINNVPASAALLASNNLSDVGNAGTARTNLSLGTAATKNTGTSEGDVVMLDATGLPAVDGSQLIGLAAEDVGGESFGHSNAMLF